MKKIFILAVSCLALSSVSALAEGPYVSADLGLAIVHDSDIKAPGVSTTAEFDMGFGLDIAAGYTFKQNVRAEAEFGYRTADVNSVGGTSVSGSDLRVMSYMVNGYYDFTQFKLPVTPYAGLGLGLMNGKVKFPGSSNDDTTLGYQLMLGVGYPVNKQVSVNAGYKLQSTFSDFEKDNTKISYTSSTLLVGARFNF